MIKKHIHYLDSTMFAKIFIESFSKISTQTEFYILNDGQTLEAYKNYSNVYYLNPKDKKAFDNHIAHINENKKAIVFFHYLNSSKQYISTKLKKDIEQCWCLWGHDFYNTPFYTDKYKYERLTSTVAESGSFISNIKKKVSDILKPLLLFLVQNNIQNKFVNVLYKRFGFSMVFVKQNFDYISYIVPKEIELLKPYFPNTKFIHLYSDPDFPFFKHFEEYPTDNNILIGNSASMSNNHLDSFELLKNINTEGRKIIVPLNYSGEASYIDMVVKKGYEYFGNSFIPVLERLPLEEYNTLLGTCSCAIMNQRRQQSGGNLFYLIGSGVKVFINPNNGFYDYFKENGIDVFSINEISEASIHSVQDLTENREKLLKLYSKEHFYKEINKLK